MVKPTAVLYLNENFQLKMYQLVLAFGSMKSVMAKEASLQWVEECE
jgi:hypothetical protein